jgi:hypothetical protein
MARIRTFSILALLVVIPLVLAACGKHGGY